MGKTVGTLQLLIGCCKTTSESDCCQNDTDDISKLPAPPPHQLKEYGYKELADVTGGFSRDYLLGEGGFGEVYEATLDGEKVAIKKLKIEMNYLGFARHPNLVKVIGHCSDGSNRLLVLEFVPNNALTYHLYETPKSLDWSERMKIAIHSAKGLEYLHDHCTPQIIHGNLTPNNIFVDNNFEPKMADFGLSIFFTDDNITHIKSDRRAQIYVDFSYKHENDRRGGSEKADVYSFGVILLELITGRGRSVDQRRTILRWSKDRIGQALDNSEFTDLVDSRLQEYDLDEMLRMISCAAASVYKSSRFRPKMKQIVQVLEGSMPWSIVWRENDKTFLTE
uniref:non-specific serine/threonine protein kinase n=1 Tax=Manihot esculenta TaxID=3983 RepID=A0A2C9W3D6_MANES